MFTLTVDDDIELRLFDMYRVQEFFELIRANVDHISPHMTWVYLHQEVEDTANFIRDARKAYGSENSYGTQIHYRGEIAGSIALHIKSSVSGRAEIGYWLGSQYTGNGIITRAARAITDFAFGTLGMHKVFIRCTPANEKSCAVAERLGFTQEGLLVDEVLDNDVRRSFKVYRMLRHEWTVQQENLEFKKALGDGLELRLFRPALADELYAVVDDNRDHLREWLPWLDDTTSPDDTREFILSGLQQYADYDGIQCGIWQDDCLVGAIGYHYWDLRHKRTEIGYWLAKAMSGRGIMTRSVGALIDYAFDVLEMHRIEIPCAVENTRSCAIPRRLGFTHEGVIRRGEWLYDHFVDLNMYSILAHEWETR